jgi:hypothetical protein
MLAELHTYGGVGISNYLDRVVVLVAGEAGDVEEDLSQGVGHPRLGAFEASDKGFVAFARRSSHRGEIAQAVLAVAGAHVLPCHREAQVVVPAQQLWSKKKKGKEKLVSSPALSVADMAIVRRRRRQHHI